MRIWLDPDRLANMQISPTEVIQAIQQENNQAAAGKIGSRPVPDRAGLRVPDHGQGAAREGDGVRGDHRPPQRRRLDRPRSRTSPASSSSRRTTRRPASSTASRPARILVYQYADANALDIVQQVRQRDGPAQPELPGGARVHASSTTRPKYVDENINEVEHTLLEAFVLVLIVVFVFLQGVPRDDHPDAGDPGRRWSRRSR